MRSCDGNVSTGRGAWEVAYRFSYIDMLDGLTNKGAGMATDHTSRPELVSEPVYQSDVQLRAFERHL